MLKTYSIFRCLEHPGTPVLILLPPVLVVPHESLPNFEDFLPHFLQPLWVVQVALENLPGLKEIPGNTKGFLKSLKPIGILPFLLLKIT
jgi:hypothetical protein